MYQEKMKFKISCKDVPVSLRRMFGNSIVETINRRNEMGVDLNGRSFTEYSKEYKNSQEYKSFNKSTPNLRLFGEMQASLKSRVIGEYIEVYYDDETEAAKAFNHNTGDTVPKREFFGVNESELKQLYSQYNEVSKTLANSIFGDLLHFVTNRVNTEPVNIDITLATTREL